MWDRVLHDGSNKDATIVCEDGAQKVQAHADILAASSPVLNAMLMGDFAEGSNKTIRVDGSLPNGTLDLFLELVYCGCSQTELTKRDVPTILAVLDLSHRWQLFVACDICERWLGGMIDVNNIANIAEVLFQFFDGRIHCNIFDHKNIFKLNHVSNFKVCMISYRQS